MTTRLNVALATAQPVPRPPGSIAATRYVWHPPETLPPRSWLYGRHFIRKFLGVTAAPGGSGKSSLGVVEALAMVSGRPLLGTQPPDRLRVWLWNGEDPHDELCRRIQAAALHYGLTADDIGDRLYVDSGREMPIVIATDDRSGAIVAEPVVEAVKATLIANRIDALVIDPFVACHAVAENDNGRIAMVARQWAEIADATNCAIDCAHHVRKSNGGGDLTADDARGAGALVAAARSVRVLNRMTEDEAARAGVEDRRLYFRVDGGAKANMAPPSDLAAWFNLQSVGLGNATDALPEDHVAVVTSWRWPDAFDDVTTDHRREVQRRVAVEEWRLDPQSTAWIGKLVADVLGIDLTEPAGREQVKRVVSTWLKNDVLRVEERKDGTRRERKFVVAGCST